MQIHTPPPPLPLLLTIQLPKSLGYLPRRSKLRLIPHDPTDRDRGDVDLRLVFPVKRGDEVMLGGFSDGEGEQEGVGVFVEAA